MTDLDECTSQISELRQTLMAKKAVLSSGEIERNIKKLVDAENFVQSRTNLGLDDISNDDEVVVVFCIQS